jgi:ribosomal protein S3
MFAHRRFLRLLATFLRPYVSLTPQESKILGFNLVVTGKISVTGNAMSRTMQVRHGKASINNLRHHALSAFALIRTRTGCLGFNLTFLF